MHNDMFCDELNGLRPGHSCLDHIYMYNVLTSIIRHRKRSASLFTYFLDFSKAFDSVGRKCLFYKLMALDYVENYIMQSSHVIKICRVVFTCQAWIIVNGSQLMLAFVRELLWHLPCLPCFLVTLPQRLKILKQVYIDLEYQKFFSYLKKKNKSSLYQFSPHKYCLPFLHIAPIDFSLRLQLVRSMY